MQIEEKARLARYASIRMAVLASEKKEQALKAIAQALRNKERDIVSANQADLAQAEKDNLPEVLIKRLKFGKEKLEEAIAGIEKLIELPDPVGKTLSCTELDTDLELYKVSCPIGVLGVIFESRPDALVQISTLALKSGNVVLLKGGSEAAHSNRTLTDIVGEANEGVGLPSGWIQMLETRQDVRVLLELDDYIDLVIPRGSNAFVKYIMDNTRIPVLGHADGICHVYIDVQADMAKALRVAFDAKCQYPAVCNAMETMLVDKKIAPEFLPLIQGRLKEAGVELRGDKETRRIIECNAAREEDWRTEYNDLILAIRVVDGVDQAIEHINTYGSHHTDAIITEDEQKARKFLDLVDSADVFWNCSTRFSDGYRYGLGAEVGISTNKIHARGPVGLEGLVIYKWILIGDGHTVEEYSGRDAKKFRHLPKDKSYR
ncbi:MAG: glutamate-5-semialdehyde dehydrogenase [Deltaproteobacteria bacterium]|nr:MAG: glutamate-5-semialdehyde dehydrogenase [Deltaproteobacteria bacterium]